MTSKMFDLNIEEVLENWEIEHGLREIIANALDEQLISNTADIQISKDEQGRWHIRDFGRGLRIEHFTLNENQEKLAATTGVIGKFGVGLKDALATFHRRGVEVSITSTHGTFSLKQAHKHNFTDIVTLHVEYDDTPTGIRGTDFILSGVSDEDIAKAKSLFLKFAGEKVLETNTYGQILLRQGDVGRVYILGVFASEEPNFLFSYNITSLTSTMRKRLNRERLHVGRTTYADRIKAILKASTAKEVHDLLIEQVRKRATGDLCDEMTWIEISQMALNLLHQQSRVVYFTEQDLLSNPNILDNARRDGFEIITITDQLREKLTTQMLSGGPLVRTIDQYVQEYNNSFEYYFVEPTKLTVAEREVYNLTVDILALIGIPRNEIPKIYISETMRLTTDATEGVWDHDLNAIVIKRSNLSSLDRYAGVLLHEVAHATTNTVDATREFERVLTTYLGKIAQNALKNRSTSSSIKQTEDNKTEESFGIGKVFSLFKGFGKGNS